MRIAIAAASPEQRDLFRRTFASPDAPATTEPEHVLSLLGSAPDIVVVDAGATWAVPVVALLPEDGPAVLVAAGQDTAASVPALLRAGADGFVALPAGEAELSVAVMAARQARARRAETWKELSDTRLQLERFADDFRMSYQRERDQSSLIAETLTRLERSYAQTVRALATAIEAKDPTTGTHTERVTTTAMALTRLIDQDLAGEPHLAFGFLLHDVGKIGVPDHILLKGGVLTVDERRVIERHPDIGARIVEGIGFLSPVGDVIRHHHERWDGNGYPDGLRGFEIPRAARIFAVADAADSMLHDRPYRRAMLAAEAQARLRAGAGNQFDAEVVEAYLALFAEEAQPVPAVQEGR